MLATGGGAVLDAGTRATLQSRGWVVYLETSVAQQAERAARSRHRPLLQGTDPVRRLEELLLEREPLYRGTADFTVGTDRRRVGAVAGFLVQKYRQSLQAPGCGTATADACRR